MRVMTIVMTGALALCLVNPSFAVTKKKATPVDPTASSVPANSQGCGSGGCYKSSSHTGTSSIPANSQGCGSGGCYKNSSHKSTKHHKSSTTSS